MSNKLEEARKIINEADTQMAELFVKRMRAVELVYEHKKEFGLPIPDPKREETVIEQNSALVEDEVLKAGHIALIGLAKDILEKCIDLLGFTAPEKM